MKINLFHTVKICISLRSRETKILEGLDFENPLGWTLTAHFLIVALVFSAYFQGLAYFKEGKLLSVREMWFYLLLLASCASYLVLLSVVGKSLFRYWKITIPLRILILSASLSLISYLFWVSVLMLFAMNFESGSILLKMLRNVLIFDTGFLFYQILAHGGYIKSHSTQNGVVMAATFLIGVHAFHLIGLFFTSLLA